MSIINPPLTIIYYFLSSHLGNPIVMSLPGMNIYRTHEQRLQFSVQTHLILGKDNSRKIFQE